MVTRPSLARGGGGVRSEPEGDVSPRHPSTADLSDVATHGSA